MNDYKIPFSDLEKTLDTSLTCGLTSEQAELRLTENGPNRLREGKKVPLWKKLLSQFTEPMTLILIVAAVVSGIMAVFENEFPTDVIIILSVVIINSVLGVLQESKAEKAIDALQKIAAATSKVIRNGRQITVRSEELTLGDLIVLEAGDAVPADARLIEEASLKAEESALTGESVPSSKNARDIEADSVPLGDRKNMVYMGSTVVYGRGKAIVTGVGMSTEMGKIADALQNAKENKTPLQIKLAQLSKILTCLVVGICVVIFGVNLIRAALVDSISPKIVLDTFMIAVSLAVAAIPEGLATVVTIVLSIGVTNMSRRNAVIRRLTAVETLGCTQVICSDKTGTLTQNKMTVVSFSGDNESFLANGLSLCSDAEWDEEEGCAVGEPTETALVDYAQKIGVGKTQQKKRFPRIGEVPFDSMRKMMTTVHQAEGRLIQFTKGAPDEILRRCSLLLKDGFVVPMTAQDREDILKQNKNMADRALRVLALAQKTLSEEPSEYSSDNLETDLCYIGLVGMIDPIRPEVKAAIGECRNAAILPIMITGDHRDTAVAIAKELGILEDEAQAITGSELERMTQDDFDVTKYRVYARVQPEHKTRIVNAWQHLGKITAMTGDGVNDAPSIKSADIGVGMGITGTDVTKNVADMILTDDNFATIVSAVGEGRRIYDNIRKSIQFLLASNLSEVLAIFTATLCGFSLFLPVHLLFINLITDCFPALSLGMEKPEDDIMNRKPRSSDEGIFSDGLGTGVVYQGLLVTAITLASYFIGRDVLYPRHLTSAYTAQQLATTMAFFTLSMTEIFHAFNMRSLKRSIFKIKHTNLWLISAAVLSLVLTTALIEVPFLANAFSLVSLRFADYLVAFGLSLTVIPIVEAVKLIRRKKENK